jgi:hypothetical protein
MKQAVRLTVLVMAAVFVIAPSDLESCGPYFRTAVFRLARSASIGGTDYARGQLGVVQPSFDRKNLVIAYRYWTGVPLNADEVVAFSASPQPQAGQTTAVQQWVDARKAIGIGNPPPVDPERQIRAPDSYDGYVNCLDDAFRTATLTLAKRSAAWGAGSANLKEWVEGQDAVFANCDGARTIPGPVASKDPLLAADRQYQVAAAAFYAGDWELARRSFDQVAANHASPWAALAPYLKARVSIREATLGGKQESFARAEEELKAAKQVELTGYVRAKSKPLDRLKEICHSLLKPQMGAAAAQSMTDFILLYDRLRDGRIGKAEELTAGSELADWIEAYQGGKQPHAIQQWLATKKLPWLVAAIAEAKGKDAEVPKLIASASEIGVDSEAYPTVNYYAALLEMDDPARQRLDTLLKQKLPQSSRNLVLEARLRRAKDWAEFMKFAPRIPAGETFDEGEGSTDWKGGAVFDEDSVWLFNRSIPLSLWMDASKTAALTARLRGDLSATAWVRAILLGKNTEARALAMKIQTQRPELATAMRNYLGSEEREAQFTAVYWMLKTPGVSPWLRSGFGRDGNITDLSEFRDNWWSKPAVETSHEAKFLTDAERKSGDEEWHGLAMNGADYLTAETVRYVKANPGDPRAAEALALAVRATHLSTTDEGTGALSKQAFDLLHANYPNTNYAKNTKYWYK